MTGTLDRQPVIDSVVRPMARRKLPILFGAAAALVALAVWVVAFSPALGARTVTVTGVHTLTAEQVRTAAAIANGTPLIRLDTSAAQRRLEALPDVARARISVSYPATVRITITERVPVGYLARDSGYVLVDKSGAQYRGVEGVPTDLPRFALAAEADARASGQAAATVAASLPATLLTQLSEVTAKSTDITLVLRDGRTVSWGSAERSDEKARLLPALLAQSGAHYDVSNPDVATVR